MPATQLCEYVTVDIVSQLDNKYVLYFFFLKLDVLYLQCGYRTIGALVLQHNIESMADTHRLHVYDYDKYSIVLFKSKFDLYNFIVAKILCAFTII